MPVPGVPNIYTLPFSTSNTMEFNWSPGTDNGNPITSYVLTIPPDSRTFTIPPDWRYYTVDNLSAAVTYYPTLAASNSDGLGPSSNFREFQCGDVPPTAISTISVTTSGSSSALISWTPPPILPDATVFWYYIQGQSTNPSDPILTASADGLRQTSLLVSGLNTNSVYSFIVRPVNCPGYGPLSTSATVTFYNPGQAKLATYMGMNTSTINATTVAVDSDGNVYMRIFTNATNAVSIYNYSSAPIGGGEVQTTLYGTITALNNQRSYLIKYNSDGQVQWATILPNMEEKFLNELPALAIDSDGNIYIVGNFAFNSNIYSYSSLTGGAIVTTTFGLLNLEGGNASYPSIYLIKYNSSGVAQWGTSIKNSGNSPEFLFPSVKVDASNNPIVGFSGSSLTGNAVFNNYSTVTSGNVIVTEFGRYSFSNYIAFVVKYNSSGTVQWVSAIENIGTQFFVPTSLGVDSTNSVYLGATVDSSRTITIKSYSSKSGTPPVISMSTFGSIATGGTAIILAKFNSSGTGLWATYIQSDVSLARQYIFCDSNNNVLFYNTWSGTVTFRSNTSGSGVSTTVYGTISLGGVAPYFVKYNSSGTIQWATYIKSSGSTVLGLPGIDSFDNIYIACQGSATIAPQNYSSPPSGGGAVGLTQYGNVPFATGSGNDCYLIKYNSAGSVVWATRIAGTLDDRRPDCFADTNGNVYVTGIYASNPITISNFSAAPVNSNANTTLTTFGTLPDFSTGGGENAFLIKYAA